MSNAFEKFRAYATEMVIALVVLLLAAAGGWMVSMDRQMQRIGSKIDNLDHIPKNMSMLKDTVMSIEQEVNYITRTRFTSQDAKEINARIRDLEERVLRIEVKDE